MLPYADTCGWVEDKDWAVQEAAAVAVAKLVAKGEETASLLARRQSAARYILERERERKKERNRERERERERE
jgi:hypothetical protein